MHPDTVRMYMNCIRTIFTKENYRKFLQMHGKDGEMAKKWIVEIKEYRDFEDFLKSKKEHLETYAEMVELDTKEIKKWMEKGELYSHTDSDDIEIAQIVNELHKDTLNIVEYNPERDTIEVNTTFGTLKSL